MSAYLNTIPVPYFTVPIWITLLRIRIGVIICDIIFSAVFVDIQYKYEKCPKWNLIGFLFIDISEIHFVYGLDIRFILMAHKN